MLQQQREREQALREQAPRAQAQAQQQQQQQRQQYQQHPQQYQQHPQQHQQQQHQDQRAAQEAARLQQWELEQAQRAQQEQQHRAAQEAAMLQQREHEHAQRAQQQQQAVPEAAPAVLEAEAVPAEAEAVAESEVKEPEKPEESACEVLQDRLEFRQHEAPSDISGIIQMVTSQINRDVQGMLGATVKYNGGDIHRIVGEHDVVAEVTQLVDPNGDETATRCYVVKFRITDTDECKLPRRHEMAHRCDPRSTTCVNTVGSYYCACKQAGDVGVAGAGFGLCENEADTSECCKHGHGGCRNYQCIADCNADFRCPVDLCPGDCDTSGGATCAMDAAAPLGYTCSCPAGSVGNGRSCGRGKAERVWKRPSSDTLYYGEGVARLADEDDLCGCQAPRVDYCAEAECGCHATCRNGKESFHCECDPGFTHVDGFGCMDESLPTLRLRGDAKMTIPQCKGYVEHGIDIDDSNAEDLQRTLRIQYSRPLGGCLPRVGEFHVNYTVATNWTDPPFTTITREVTVVDIDECMLAKRGYYRFRGREETPNCEDCEAKCAFDGGAVCRNTPGSYTCACPHCTSGDGFAKGFEPRSDRADPQGFDGGTGCTDSCPPVITLHGSEPLVIPTCACEGLDGGGGLGCSDRDFGAELKAAVGKPGGLCRLVKGADRDYNDGGVPGRRCVSASDEPGSTDVSNDVRIGAPEPLELTDELISTLAERIPELEWTDRKEVEERAKTYRISHDVSDAVGNAAETQYRTVTVLTLSMSELRMVSERRTKVRMENQLRPKIYKEAMKDLESKREKRGGGRGGGSMFSSCPEPEPCDCLDRPETCPEADMTCPKTDGQGCPVCPDPEPCPEPEACPEPEPTVALAGFCPSGWKAFPEPNCYRVVPRPPQTRRKSAKVADPCAAWGGKMVVSVAGQDGRVLEDLVATYRNESGTGENVELVVCTTEARDLAQTCEAPETMVAEGESWMKGTPSDVTAAIQSAAAQALIDDLSPLLVQILAGCGIAVLLVIAVRFALSVREDVKAKTPRKTGVKKEGEGHVYRTFSPRSRSARPEPDLTPLRPDPTIGTTPGRSARQDTGRSARRDTR